MRNFTISPPADEYFNVFNKTDLFKNTLKTRRVARVLSDLAWHLYGIFCEKGNFDTRKNKMAIYFPDRRSFSTGELFHLHAEQGNFHPITKGESYRSAQLDRDELKHYIGKYNIKSIINLRGKRTRRSWYREELEISKRYGVRHYDLSIPADKSPSADQVAALRHIFETAPRPLLLHCKAGADRAGLAAALWKVVVDREPKAQARKQLSLRFGHFPIGPTSALDDFFTIWQPEKI